MNKFIGILCFFSLVLSLASNSYAVEAKKSNLETKVLKKSSSDKKESLESKKKADLTKQEQEKLVLEAKEIKKTWSTRNSKFLSESTQKRHLRAQQYLASKKYKDAIEVIDRVIKRGSSTKYEIAKTKMLAAKIYMADEKLDQAEVNVKEAIELEQLSYIESVEALLILSQVQLMSKNVIDAKRNLILYNNIADSTPAAYVMLSSIDFELENFKEAQVSIDKALSLTKKPQEPWLYLAANVHYKNKSYDSAVSLFKQLIEKKQTNKNYWIALIGVLFEQNKAEEALAYFEMANKLGYVKTESEILSRTAVQQASNIPYKAAVELEKALNDKKVDGKKTTYESLAGYWFSAKDFDKAVQAYEKASEMATDGKIDVILGQLYLEVENWNRAERSFKRALSKGNLKNQAGQVYMGLGMANFFSNDKDQAISYFSKAKSFKSQKDGAEKWISYLN